MKKAIFTTGPQGAGKTTFCREILSLRSDIVYIESDALVDVLQERGVSFDPYCGGHLIIPKLIEEQMRATFSYHEDVTIIVDYWNCAPNHREELAKRFRRYGAEEVELWYFVTPEDICLKQFMAREKRNSGPALSFKEFHSRLIEPEGQESCLDSVKMINPCQLTLFPYAYILL